tara:strand:- start:2782 stop:5055 length:2274 start_codon:yes stop_codon:yes gene_type:complete
MGQILYLIDKKLENNGNLLIVLPAGFFWSHYIRNERKKITYHYKVTHIIDLPKSYNTSVQLKLLIVNKSSPDINDIIYMPKIKDLNVRSSIGESASEIVKNTIDKTGSFWVNRQEIVLSNRWDRRFHDPQNKEIEQNLLNQGNAKKLSEISLIIPGKHFPEKLRKIESDLLVIKPQNIQNNNFEYHKSDYFIDTEDLENSIKVREGDLIINSIGPKFKFCLIPQNVEGVINQNLFLIRSELNEFIDVYLQSNTGNEEFSRQVNRYRTGSTVSKLHLKDLKNILVPSSVDNHIKYLQGIGRYSRTNNEFELTKLFSADFILNGWQVKVSERIGNIHLDIGLYHNDRIVSFVEIKKSRNEVFLKSQEKKIIDQCQNSISIIEEETSQIINGCFVIIDYDIFFLKDNRLEQIKSIPLFSDYRNILYPFIQGRQQRALLNKTRIREFKDIEPKNNTTENEGFNLNQRLLLDLMNEMKGMNNKMDKIDQKMDTLTINQESLHSKTDKILSNLDLMMDEVKEIKSLTANTNESIEKAIVKIINVTDNNYNFSDVERYIPRIKKWFDFWNTLESESKVFMPRSEYLHDLISESDFDDYSPYVLYYCRVLELELFRKIFYQFGVFLKEKNKEINELFNYDKENLSNRTIKDIEDGMMRSFKNKLINNDSKYSLGEMRLILDLLPDSESQKTSRRFKALKVLQELEAFINSQVGSIPKELIKEIKEIIDKYRNPSAHVGEINKDNAKKFFNAYKGIMVGLIRLFDN